MSPPRLSAASTGLACALALFGCSDGAPGAGTPPLDAAPEASPPPARPPETCSSSPVDRAALCAGRDPCPVVRAVDVTCTNSLDAFDLAVAGDGHAVVALHLQSQEAVVVEIARDATVKATNLGKANRVRAAARASADSARVLVAHQGQGRLVHKDGAGWTAEPVALGGELIDFDLGPQGEPQWLEARNNAGDPDLALTAPGAPPTVVTKGPWAFARLLADPRSGQSTVILAGYGWNQTVSRWQAGTISEIGRVSALWEDELSAALAGTGGPLVAWTERGKLLLHGDAAPFSILVDAPPWTTPSCSGMTTAYYPANCPSDSREVSRVGVHASPLHALAVTPAGEAYYAVITGEVTVGCFWSGGGCIETMTCHCSERDYEAMSQYQLRVGHAGSGSEWIIDARDVHDGTRVGLAADGQGQLMVARGSSNELHVVVLDPGAF